MKGGYLPLDPNPLRLDSGVNTRNPFYALLDTSLDQTFQVRRRFEGSRKGVIL